MAVLAAIVWGVYSDRKPLEIPEFAWNAEDQAELDQELDEYMDSTLRDIWESEGRGNYTDLFITCC